MNQLPLSVRQSVTKIAEALYEEPARWLLGGSCGLLLQGVALDREPRDVDLYTDDADAPAIAAALSPYATDELQYNETPIYRSRLGHFDIAGIPIELVGGFRVEADESCYEVEIGALLEAAAVRVKVEDAEIKLMPLAHELVFNLLRDRPDRYVAIAAAMRCDSLHERHRTLLRDLVQRNRLTSALIRRIADLTGMAF